MRLINLNQAQATSKTVSNLVSCLIISTSSMTFAKMVTFFEPIIH